MGETNFVSIATSVLLPSSKENAYFFSIIAYYMFLYTLYQMCPTYGLVDQTPAHQTFFSGQWSLADFVKI